MDKQESAADVVIPIVFPDYLIGTPAGKLPELGHAGVLLIQGTTGLTKYYEYGRYDPPANRGLVKKRSVPDVMIDKKTGKPTLDSLAKTLKVISREAGQGGRIEGAYIEKANSFPLAMKYAETRLKDNKNPRREEYKILSNSCLHFMRKTTEAGGVNTPWLVDPRPNSYIGELRGDFQDLDYDPKADQVKIGK
ncbi:MAG TPA: hypothetical protein VF590_03085 [Isosphaeraceae bacterium]|jgi:hypothetical protein